MSEKSFTMRLSEDTYEEIKKRADKSVTQFVREAVVEKLRRTREQEYRRSLLALIDDDEDMAPLKAAQRRVIENVD